MTDDKEDEKAIARAATRKAVHDIPALFLDTYHVSLFPGYVRITFGEEFDDGDRFRTAVVMPISEAELLCGAITKLGSGLIGLQPIHNDGG